MDISKPGNEEMKTRSSSSPSSGDLVPAGNSREAHLPIVALTLSRNISLHGLNRPRPSSLRSKGGADDLDRRSYASKGFHLPKGWTVEESPRRNFYHIDRFYVKRKTGKWFRSLVSIERYLKKESGSRKYRQQLVLLEQNHLVPSKDFNLPDGWTVEKKSRRNSCRIDRFYIETGTGKKFCSLPDVERYLNGAVDSVQQTNHPVDGVCFPDFGEPDGIGFESVDIDPIPPDKVKWMKTRYPR